MRRAAGALVAVTGFVVIAAAIVYALNVRDESPSTATSAFAPTADDVRRGAYLARAGDCIACHTARGGAAYAGGRPIETPFGIVYGSNLTPDARTGIGTWTADDFWRALHNGRSRDGRLLYPAFPYPNFTQVTRGDADALFAYLRTLPAVSQPNTPHALRFPYDNAIALALWRALFFRPGVFEPERGQTAEWNRGAYLVRGLGHCDACHAGRNLFGAVSHTLELGGGLIPMQNWYAPPLTSAAGAGVADWETEHVVSLLRTGISPRGSAMGPMAEVVYLSTQYLSQEDLGAIAVFLKALPQAPDPPPATAGATDPRASANGAKLYDDHCSGCHGKEGQGAYPAYPALAGNRTVTADPPANAIRAVISGGYAPATTGNPRPYGMPPFVYTLREDDIASVLSYVRGAWGNQARPVTTFDVHRYR